MDQGSTRQIKIAAHLLRETQAELDELARDDVDPYTKRLYARGREFYWTVTRALGIGHLHDGSWRRPSQAEALSLRPLISGEIIAPPDRGRLLVDMTPTHRRGKQTGIQRVVREIARAAAETGAGLPVFIEDGRVYSHYRHPSLPDELEIGAGDILLLLDPGWHLTDEYAPVLERASRAGATIVACLYDLIPVLHPAATARETIGAFRAWFDLIVRKSDALIGISKTVIDEFIDYARDNRLPLKSDLHLGWWRLGADFAPTAGAAPSLRAADVASRAAPFFLSVGTMEPRKGYSAALDAFDKLWARGVDARYVIVGRRGWNTRALQRRIREHREHDRRLFWLEDAGDADLAYLYRRAAALVFPSFVEGFGLPLVEAAHFGAPIIASDIPVFREIGGDAVVYFDLLDAHALATRIEEASATRPPVAALDILSWRQSTSELVEVLRGGDRPGALRRMDETSRAAPSTASPAKGRIEAFFLAEIHAELAWRDEERIDDSTRRVYRKAREFYWTVERMTRGLRRAVASPFACEEQPVGRPAPATVAAPRLSRRLLVDVTPTHRHDIGSGIQRVAREIARAMVASGEGVPVFIHEGALFGHFDHPALPRRVVPQEGDTFVMLDASWAHRHEYPPIMDVVSRAGGANVAVVYDLMPMRYPAAFTRGAREAFAAWFDEIVLACDAVATISKSVAQEFFAFVATHERAPKPGQRLGWWRLGADFSADPHAPPSRRIAAICDAPTPFFLTVGTLAPTKAQSFALSVFERLWSEGVEARYVLVGKRSWNTHALEARIRAHPQSGDRLLWLEDADDGELRALYSHARSLVYPSFTEGFGLPLVEAAHFGAPIIASDIPVFREIGGDALAYFDLLDQDSLAARLREALAADREPIAIPTLSWRESAHALANFVRGEAPSLDASGVTFGVVDNSAIQGR
jgi:alpha-1,2-rhamnosyltransferase